MKYMPKRLSEEERKARDKLMKEREKRLKKREDKKESKRLASVLEPMIDDTQWWLSFGKKGNFKARIVNGSYAPSMLRNILKMIEFANETVDKENNYAAWFWCPASKQRLKIAERRREDGKFYRLLYCSKNGPVVLDFQNGYEAFIENATKCGMSKAEARLFTDYHTIDALDDYKMLIEKSLKEKPQ